jgi:ABC-2 type transport system permease protein
MGKVLAIAGRELRSYFVSPLAWVVGALFLLVSSYLFSLILFSSREASLRGLFENLAVVFLLITPALTMRLLAEERSRGTIELLMTAPVRDRDIVIGKYLAVCLYLLFLLVLTGIYPVTLALIGKPDWMPIIAGYAGVFLLGASFLAVGLMASSWTNNVVISALATFGISLVIWLLPSSQSVFGQQVGQVLEYCSVITHQQNMGRGVIDTTDVLFYGSFIFVCLFLTIRSVEVYRWR